MEEKRLEFALPPTGNVIKYPTCPGQTTQQFIYETNANTNIIYPMISCTVRLIVRNVCFIKNICTFRGRKYFNSTWLVQDMNETGVYRNKWIRVKVKDQVARDHMYGCLAEEAVGIERNLQRQREIKRNIIGKVFDCSLLFAYDSEKENNNYQNGRNQRRRLNNGSAIAVIPSTYSRRGWISIGEATPVPQTN